MDNQQPVGVRGKSGIHLSLLNFFLILIIVLIISGAATGAAVYLGLQGRITTLEKQLAENKKNATANTEQTALLQQKINQLENELAAVKQPTTNTNTSKEPNPLQELTKEDAEELSVPTEANYIISRDDIPIVVYTPAGLFTDAMKDELWEKLASPYFDYNNEKELAVYTMNIEMTEDKPAGFLYKVTVIGREHDAGFLWAEEEKEMPYWIPGCMTPCEFSDVFTIKHPEVVEQYKKTPQ